MPGTGFYDMLTGLYRSISRIHNRRIQSGLYRDLSASDFMVLRFIASKKSPAMSEIASTLQVTQGTLTVAVNRLVKKGYVRRARMEQDRRIVRISLTGTGYSALKEELEFYGTLQAQYAEALGEERAKEFSQMLAELVQYFKKQEG